MSEAKVKPVPDGMPTVTPHIVCANALEAIEFYKRAFGAEEEFRLTTPQGALMHAQIRIGGSPIMMAEEMPNWGCLGPKALKGSPVTLHLYVPDVDAAMARAAEAGAKVTMPAADMFWGDRYGQVEDPYGHRWSLATHVRDVSPEELQKAAQEAAEHGCG